MQLPESTSNICSNLLKAVCTCLLGGLLSNAVAQQSSSVFVHFDFNRYELSRGAKASLDSLTDSLDVSDRIELHGHCDAIGSDEYNNVLSEKRVLAVKKYLLGIGWDSRDILIVQGHGESLPLASNDDAVKRSLNRRVEIKVKYGIPGASNTVKPPAEKPPTIKEKIADSAVKTGTNLVLRNINFAGGLHRFLAESYPMLEELLDAMQTYPKLVIRVEGHICCNPTPADGLDNETGIYNLSEARAKAVRDYLIDNGISGNRVTYKGFGHSAPLYPYPEKSLEEEKLNRRVEIKIISK